MSLPCQPPYAARLRHIPGSNPDGGISARARHTLAAVMFAIWAFLPDSRCWLTLITETLDILDLPSARRWVSPKRFFRPQTKVSGFRRHTKGRPRHTGRGINALFLEMESSLYF